MADDRITRLRTSIARHIRATKDAVRGMGEELGRAPTKDDLVAAGEAVAPSPAAAVRSLTFIRSLQDIADILDEEPPSDVLTDPDSTSREALVTLAVAILSRDLAATQHLNVARPFRRALSRVFPNELIRRLKEIRDDGESPDYDA